MPDGHRPEPGGWNRIIVQSRSLEGEILTLRKAGVVFRNDVTSGPGGRQILLEDPSGNLVELFEPAGAREGSTQESDDATPQRR
jgi:glyoxylase I family protein